jgi:hypothetical protein
MPRFYLNPMKRQPPQVCDVCRAPNPLFTTEMQALGTNRRKWPYVYFCTSCKAVVGCHPNLNLPLGYMADAHTRHHRANLHELIDPFWKSGLATRHEIYQWLAKELGLLDSFCHIAQLTNTELVRAIKLAEKYRAMNITAIEKAFDDKKGRKEKRRSSRYRQFR